jgi:hypothetical protein
LQQQVLLRVHLLLLVQDFQDMKWIASTSTTRLLQNLLLTPIL